MNIAIYQINPDRDENNVAFLNYENMERFQGSAELRSEIYDKVFEGKVDCGALEEVYQMFNLDHPDGYRGRSLSVSDVIEVVGEEKSTFHFCDSIGFREVDFDPDMTEPLKEKKIKVVLCEPGKVARVAEIGTELSDLQRVVGGLIEPYYPLPWREFVESGFDGREYQFPDFEGTFAATIACKRWDRNKNLLAYLDFDDGRKIMTSAWSEKNYLGLADIPLNTRVSVSFQFSAKGVSYLRSVEVI